MKLVNQVSINKAQMDEVEQEVYEIERHLHNRERWMGVAAVPTATHWADENSLTSFQAISGNADWGTDPGDEAEVLGSIDTPVIVGRTRFDMRRIEVVSASSDTTYLLQFAWGTGTLVDALAAGNYSVVAVDVDTGPPVNTGAPVDVLMPRVAAGSKVWARAKNATNNATINFLVGLHEYEV